MQSNFLTADAHVPGLGGEIQVPGEANLAMRRAGMRSPIQGATLGFIGQTIFHSVLLYYAIPAAGVGVMGLVVWLGSDKLAAYGLMIALSGCALGGLAPDEE